MGEMGRLERVVKRAKAESSPPQQVETSDGARDEFPEFPHIAKMTLQEIEERITQLDKKREGITSWGDIGPDDRKLLDKIDRELAALKKVAALKTAPGAGVRHAA